MVSPGSKLKPHRMVTFADDFRAEILETTARGPRLVKLTARGGVDQAIERHGHIPLPPYIDRSDEAA